MKKKPKVVETHPKNPKMNSDAVTAVIGIDLGDKRSAYCIVDMNGSVIGERVSQPQLKVGAADRFILRHLGGGAGLFVSSKNRG